MTAINVAALRAELYRAVDETLDRVLGAATAQATPVQATPEAEPKRMKVSQYARERGYASRTVTGYCALGMPHVGRGRARRILVAEADEWLAKGGPAAAVRAAGAKAQDDERTLQ